MKIIPALTLVALAAVCNAQTNYYLADLDALKSILQKTPSYKAQIKGGKLEYYNALYDRLVTDTVVDPDTYNYFYNLSQLVFPLRDNHLGFYQLPNYNNFKTQANIDSFIRTREFSNYPTCKINIDSLKNELAKKPPDSIEGIYYYDKFYSVGLFKNADREYTGVVLDSDIGLWRKGQIAIHLYEYGQNLYKAIYGHPLFKNFILLPNEKYGHQSLMNSYFYASYSQSIYTKHPQQVDYVNLPKSASRFEMKTISDDIQYVLVQSFQRNNETVQDSRKFYDSIQNALIAPNLILDLRNNEGGSRKEMTKYLALLKSYTRKGHLYVLLNYGTLSQAEIFVLQLKELKNVTTVGETTRGMLTYGSNYGKRQKLPGGRFEVYPTDMKGNAKLLQYEDYGIDPDIILSDKSDWVKQVGEIIKK